MGIKRVIRKWLGIEADVARAVSHQDHMALFIDAVGKRFDGYDKLNRMDIDVGARAPCTIVLTGVFQGRGYVKFYDVSIDEFQHIVREYQERRKHSLVRNVDAPPQFYGAFDMSPRKKR